jgi:hypothetical protein
MEKHTVDRETRMILVQRNILVTEEQTSLWDERSDEEFVFPPGTMSSCSKDEYTSEDIYYLLPTGEILVADKPFHVDLHLPTGELPSITWKEYTPKSVELGPEMIQEITKMLRDSIEECPGRRDDLPGKILDILEPFEKSTCTLTIQE